MDCTPADEQIAKDERDALMVMPDDEGMPSPRALDQLREVDELVKDQAQAHQTGGHGDARS